MESLPSPSVFLAVNVDNAWHRARMIQDEDGEGKVEVFLVDTGRVVTVARGNVRRLKNCFTILPFQAHEVELNLLEAPRGGWTQEAAITMVNLAEDCDHLSGKVVKIYEKLVMDVSTVKGEEEDEEDIGQRLCDLGLANRIVVGYK